MTLAKGRACPAAGLGRGGAARPAGLERVQPAPDALALYVEDGASSIAEIVRRLEREEIRAGAISVARPSLDDVFLKATGRRLEEGEEQREQEAAPEEVGAR